MENTEADGANGILRNLTITVLLDYLGIFWKSHEVSLTNCKFELTPKSTNYCVFSTADADNDNANPKNIIF